MAKAVIVLQRFAHTKNILKRNKANEYLVRTRVVSDYRYNFNPLVNIGDEKNEEL